MRLPPFFWPLTLLVLAAADCGMVIGHPPYGVFSLALPALVAVAAAVAFVLGRSLAAAVVIAIFAALAGFALGFLLPLNLLFVVLVALVLAGMAASMIWNKVKGADK